MYLLQNFVEESVFRVWGGGGGGGGGGHILTLNRV